MQSLNNVRESTYVDPPTIVDFIEREMQARGLTQRDLIPIIGSRSKVSEILSGDRDITMPMARALYKHLGIPPDVLLQEPPDVDSSDDNFDWARFPLREMINRGWIENVSNPKKHAKEIVTPLRDAAEAYGGLSMFRRNGQNRVNAKTNPYALLAWQWRICSRARDLSASTEYREGSVTPEFMMQVARLSPSSDGPRLATEALLDQGISVVCESHLSRTHLDAAVFFLDGKPVIGLTLRYDRIDSFWFTLMHELAHLAKHSKLMNTFFAEDLSMNVGRNKVEEEADDLARDSLIPADAWADSEVMAAPTAMAVVALAGELGIHPAIVAGRVRYTSNDFRKLSQFVGTGTVRRQFGFK